MQKKRQLKLLKLSKYLKGNLNDLIETQNKIISDYQINKKNEKDKIQKAMVEYEISVQQKNIEKANKAIGDNLKIHNILEARDANLKEEARLKKYYLAASGESCATSCEKKKQICDQKAIENIRTVESCKNIITNIQKREGVSDDNIVKSVLPIPIDNAGCTYNKKANLSFLQKIHISNIKCDQVTNQNTQRVCNCKPK